MKRQLLYVEWLDHSSEGADGRWVSKSQLDKAGPMTCHTIGWIYKEDKMSVTLVSTHGDEEDTDFGGDMTIIKSTIIKRKKVEL